MELTLSEIETWSVNLQKKSDEVDVEVFRKIIRTCHLIEARRDNDQNVYFNSDIIQSTAKLTEILIGHVKSGLDTIEGQTLCATAYCTLFVILSDEHCEVCLRNLNTILSCYLLQQTSQMENNLTNTLIITNNAEERKEQTKITTLISGIFKTNLLMKLYLPESSRLRQLAEAIMKSSFKISTKACLAYSSNTFIQFRNLHSIIVKLIEWVCCERIIGDIKNILLFVVFNNWENLLSGIREVNFKIWKLYLSLLDQNNPELFESIFACILKFPWNKAKYFILSEIISHLNCDIRVFLENNPTCLSGVEYSLKYSSLVSAGSDMYKSILHEFASFEDWSNSFFKFFKDTLRSHDAVRQSNIINYWIPVTVKKYPQLIECLLDFFFTKHKQPNDLFPLLSVIKLGRKLGFILADWEATEQMKYDYKKTIETGLIHINEEIRSQAFQIVCFTQKNNMPTIDEFEKMKNFLELNVNSDSTSFRQNNLTCFTVFLTRIRDSCLNLLKNSAKADATAGDSRLNEIGDFFVWVNTFLMQNLNSRGNYQRKIFSLQIYDVILRYLCGGYKDKENIKKSLCRKGNLRDQGWKVATFLEERNKWLFNDSQSVKMLISCVSDSTNDIREIATDILIQYFSNHRTFKKSRENFFINGLILSNSKLFYEAECGGLMFKIIANLNITQSDANDPIKRLIQPHSICQYLLNKAWEQFTFQESDLLLSIYNNQPLHGMISAINMYIKNSLQVHSSNYMAALIKFLCTVTSHFINILSCKSESSNLDVPPSFAEMGKSIEHIIETSELKGSKKESERKQHLSNAHQLILNNIWLNLKACCDLSSTLITHHIERLTEADIRTLLDVNISVLLKCRHKGAIESAGVSLGHTVKHLTSLRNPVYSSLIANILKDFLRQSTSENIHDVSVTRKSAGLSILVYRIVINDSENGKPLFYLTMDVLLRVLSKTDKQRLYTPAKASVSFEDTGPSVSKDTLEDFSNERDVPLARALHLLCRTVLESSLASYVIQFAPQLATVCFNHLSNEQWQVRNAALQLYGALVPKLIGQRKSQGEDTFIKSPVSPDELFSHIPSLWNHIKNSLHEACLSDNELISHSNIVPILSLLSSMANRYDLNSFCVKEANELNISIANLEDIFPNLIKLIGSPIYNIRNITANITASFFSLEFFLNHWSTVRTSPFQENQVHGYLLTVKQYVAYFMNFNKYLYKNPEKKEYLNSLRTVLSEMDMIIKAKNSSFAVKALHLEIELLFSDGKKDYVKLIDNAFKTIDCYGTDDKLQIGIYHWLQLNVINGILNCQEEELLTILKQCVESNSSILVDLDYWSTVKTRVENSLRSAHDSFQETFEYLLDLSCNKEKPVSNIVYEILYLMSSRSRSVTYFGLVGRIFCNLSFEESASSYQSGYLLPLICSMACDKEISCSNMDVHLEISRICKLMSKPEQFEVANRKIAAVSMKHLAKLLQYYRHQNITNDSVNEIRTNILIASLWLLQDEDINLRTECSKMRLRSRENDVKVHPNIHINTILSVNYLSKTFSNCKMGTIKFLQTLSKELNSTSYQKPKANLQNPFDHNTPNIYWEPLLMSRRAMKLKIIVSERV